MLNFLLGVGMVTSLLMLALQIRSRNAPGHVWVTSWFILTLVTYLTFIGARASEGTIAISLAYASSTAFVALLPAQYLYCRTIIGHPSRRVWLHVAPPLANLAFVLIIGSVSQTEVVNGFAVSQNGFIRWTPFFTIGATLLLALYPGFSLWWLLQARRRLTDKISVKDGRKVNWSLAWVASTFIILLSAIAADISELNSSISTEGASLVMFAALAAQLLIVGMASSLMPDAFEAPPISRMKSIDQDSQSLEEMMRRTKAYTRAGLSVDALAKQLGWSSARVTQAVKASGTAHFNDYLNHWRVQAVIEGMTQTPSRPVLELATESGFGSKSSFNHAFRRHVGMSPTEYKKSLMPQQV